MLEDFAREAVELARGLGPWEAILVVFSLALLIVLKRKIATLKLPPMPPVSPDPQDSGTAPPITLRPDGSIPVSNEQGPPDPTQG